MMFRYFTHSNSYRYIESLPRLVNSYNNTFHSAINTTPNSVNRENQEIVWQLQYSPDEPTNINHKFKIGDTVRILNTA